MIADSVALRYKPQHRATHAKVKKIQVVDRRDSQDPDTVPSVPEVMHYEGRKKESRRHGGPGR
jgi:hypothetical protein